MSAENLNSISTMWTMLRNAHGGTPDAAAAARQLLVERYGPAVRRYLGAALRDPHAADDLTQEFALALIGGQFHNADRDRGRFRNYVKTTLFHLVSAHRKKEHKLARNLADDAPEPAAQEEDKRFDESWRDQLLARAWSALKDAQPSSYAILRFRADHPAMSSGEMATRLSESLGKPQTGPGVRKALERARDKFADLLLDDVADSLDAPTKVNLADELAAVGLLDYCREALDRRDEPPACAVKA